ncbi:MAG: hypothetical protein QOE55_5229, partial [Acidobacteriaceae bacterium]|nr:hypothetical protein [Acidobacteriaceae bacterium]
AATLTSIEDGVSNEFFSRTGFPLDEEVTHISSAARTLFSNK